MDYNIFNGIFLDVSKSYLLIILKLPQQRERETTCIFPQPATVMYDPVFKSYEGLAKPIIFFVLLSKSIFFAAWNIKGLLS